MRFVVETWAPEYGTSVDGDDLDPTRTDVDVGVEVAEADWAPRSAPAAVRLPSSVLFVDGVRRVDARVWLDGAGGRTHPGICASYAAGAVRCDGRAEVVAARVERGLFTAHLDAESIETGHGRFTARFVGLAPAALTMGLQNEMGGLEATVVADLAARADLVVVDGPLRNAGAYLPDAVGYVKSHYARYLPDGLDSVVAALRAGERTPLFLLAAPLQTKWSWYLRLPGTGGHPWAGVARCEVSAEMPLGECVELADTTGAVLPRFASLACKDPRAPQNLVPVGGLERRLRHLLGDADLLYRALGRAAKP